MSTMSADHMVEMMTPQALTIVIGLCVFIIIATCLTMTMKIYYYQLVTLVFLSLCVMFLQGMSVNCMVHGGCEVLAWVFAIGTLLNIGILLFRLGWSRFV